MSKQAIYSTRIYPIFWDGVASDEPKSLAANADVVAGSLKFSHVLKRANTVLKTQGSSGTQFSGTLSDVSEPGTLSFDLYFVTGDTSPDIDPVRDLLTQSLKGVGSFTGDYSAWTAQKLPLGGDTLLTVILVATDPNDNAESIYYIFGKAKVSEMGDVTPDGSGLKFSVTIQFFEDPTQATADPRLA